MEENRRFSWSDLLIKMILVIIFILFTVWLLSLSNKKMTNSLDVLTDDIFAKNMERMKEVGKDYFTIERLPQKVGEVKVLTLEKMYQEKFLLELKDKNGKTCSAKYSYVSIEKFDNEYQMKVYLECDNESDYIIVIMGCYDYCDADICERQEEVKDEEYVKGEVPAIEYEYKKTTGGHWTDYGSWSEWSKVEITKADYRQVETKVVKEEYTYDKVVTETVFKDFVASCPDGYRLTNDGTKCYKEVVTTTTKNPTCPSLSGYTLVSQNGFTCNYSKIETVTASPEKCAATYGDYTLVSQDGFTCNYSKQVKTPYKAKETYTGTCYKTDTVTVYPCTGCAPQYQKVQKSYSCQKTRTVTKYKTETLTEITTVSCPSGYNNVNGTCTKNTTVTDTKNADCLSGYDKSGSSCVKKDVKKDEKDIIKSCSVSYKLTSDNTKCYKDVEKTVEEIGIKEVTYYRYRIREYVGGTVDYKWSTSKNDKNLLNAGYKLTGRTR